MLVAPFSSPSWIPVASVNLTRPPCTQPSRGNLGQALSLLIKKGIFFVIHWGRSMGIRGGRRRIINTAASASRCHRNGQLFGCVCFVFVCFFFTIGLRCSVLPLLLLWRMQLSLCSAQSSNHTEFKNHTNRDADGWPHVSFRQNVVLFYSGKKEHLRVIASPDLGQGLCTGDTNSRCTRGFTTNPKPHWLSGV